MTAKTTSQISDENFQMYKETFECFCDNQGDTVWVRKLEKLLHCVGYNPTVKEMKEYMRILDKGGHEKINFDEFIKFMEKVQVMSGCPEDQVSELVKAFRHFDSDGSGFLERVELKKFLSQKGVEEVSEDDVEYILDVADVNKDGRIDCMEFAKILGSF